MVEADVEETKTVPAAVAAALIMVSPRRLQQLAAEGFIPRPTAGGYSLAGVVQGYLRFLKDDGARAAAKRSHSPLGEARVAEIQQRMEARDKVLLREAVEAAQAVLDAAAGGLKADLLSIPARVTKDIPLRRKLEDEINEALRRAAVQAGQRAAEGGP